LNPTLSEGKAKDTKRKIVTAIRKIREIKKFILNSNSLLSHGLSQIAEHLHQELKDDLYHYKIVTLEQIFYALYQKEKRGVLCVRVFQELQKIGNKTPIETVMKGLLTPNEHRDVENISLAKAEEELRIFLKDVEFVTTVIRRGQISSSVVKKYEGVVMRVIIDNLGEFQSAKRRLEEVQDKTGGGEGLNES
jgi:UDP-N-acetylmuramate-alanine ligase